MSQPDRSGSSRADRLAPGETQVVEPRRRVPAARAGGIAVPAQGEAGERRADERLHDGRRHRDDG